MEAIAAAHRVCPACNSRYGDEVGFCSRDGTPLVADPSAGKADLAGQVLAERYRIVRLIGEGGMGQVYEAQHVNINKRFALKLLRPEIVANPEAVARFRQEAWSASSIGHENIIEIDDFATLPNGSVYLAMEFLKGRALSERMRTPPPLQLDEALEIFLQVCRGLEAAHAKGIVHRDMKPENIFLAEKHSRVIAKILDFGIAKVSGAEGSQSLTRTGTIFGTPHYMSPEQALGRALDHRSDIYSMGVIMYEAFTGRVPFEAESFMGILTKHITAQPTPPHEIAPDRAIPPEIEAVIIKAMAKDANDRFQTMGEVVLALVTVAEQLAPHVLTSPSGSISAQISSQMPAMTATPSGMRAVMPGSGATPSSLRPVPAGAARPSGAVGAAGARPSGVVTPSTMPNVDDEDELTPARASRTGLWIGLVVALGGLGAAAYLILGHPGVTTPPPEVKSVPPVAPKVDPRVAPKVDPKLALKVDPPVAANVDPPAAKDVVILVDSEPVGSQILLDGAVIGDTPRNITLAGGKPETLVIRKKGFLDSPLLLDGRSEPRRIVRMVRVHGKDNHPPVKLPPPPATPPPTTPATTVVKAGAKTMPVTPAVSSPPTVAPPLVGAPPRGTTAPQRGQGAKHGASRDPYERVDEPKKSSDVINPY